MEDENGGSGTGSAGQGAGQGLGSGSGPGTGPRSFTGRRSGEGQRSGNGVGPDAAAGLFDHEKLIAFQVAEEFYELVNKWLTRKMSRDEHDQFDRSIRSLLSNIGEGASKFARAEKRRYYEMARGSGGEAATQLSMMRMRGIITQSEYAQARALLLRVVKMLSRLCAGPRTS